MTRTLLMRGLFIALALYVACAVLARLLAARALYYPDMGSRRPATNGQNIVTPDGSQISVVYLPNPNARFTIWFFHGNAEDLGDIEPWLITLRGAGYSVFAAEYPGYGSSAGRPTESAIYASARAARSYLREHLKVSPEHTLIFGRSVGGGPAVQMATEERVAGLILQSTFTSVYRVLTQIRVLPFDYFENERKLTRISSPVLIMHGRQDEVIPFAHAERLFASAKEPKRSLWVPAAAHNDFLVVAGRDFWNTLREFSELCAQRGDAPR